MPRAPLPAEPFPFAGFTPAALGFLRALAADNTRAFFEAHRDEYETQLRAPLEALVAAVNQELARRKVPLHSDPRRALFRIHRDVRFAKDKSPYKTNAGAVITRPGAAKMAPGLLYIHIDPAGCFAAAGFYQPEPRHLEAMRGAIAADPKAYRRALAAAEKAGLALSADDAALQRVPSGYAHLTDPDLADSLRRKSFTFRRKLSATEIRRPDLPTTVAGVAEAALPFLRFFWAAIDG